MRGKILRIADKLRRAATTGAGLRVLQNMGGPYQGRGCVGQGFCYKRFDLKQVAIMASRNLKKDKASMPDSKGWAGKTDKLCRNVRLSIPPPRRNRHHRHPQQFRDKPDGKQKSIAARDQGCGRGVVI